MKNKTQILLCSVALLGIVLTTTTSCKKDSDDGPAPATTVADRDGNTYNFVTIGTQVWMTSNLKTTKYNDGTSIPNITASYQWSTDGTGGYAYYDNNPGNDSYGVLYNWFAVNTGQICPPLWRVATENDWNTLINHLGGMYEAGGKLKSTRTKPTAAPSWESPNTGATDQSSFSALPGGYRLHSGGFFFIGEFAQFWTATLDQQSLPYYKLISYGSGAIATFSGAKTNGMSVRCVKI
jgi:uncharacterized protein (TIGR02145 family)